MSIMLHAGLFAFVLFSPGLFAFREAEKWGTATGGDGIKVTIEGTVSGIALPSPEVTNDKAAANDSKGFYHEEPAPVPAPAPEKAEPIPSRKASAPKKTTVAPKPPAAKNAAPAEAPPSNAVPYGKGGSPTIGYGQFSTQPGVGSGFGDGAFGTKYAEYVNTMNRKISQNWLKGLVDSSIQRAPRVYLSFDIERDGTISNIELTQSSGIPSLDNSAKRALYASNRLPPLPADYSGARVRVKYYFEYIK